MKHFFTLALTALSFGAFAQTGDPAACYNPNSAVYACTMVGVEDGYDDGYADGLAACTPDTVTVTISNDAYYLNTILLLDSALTILQQENTELTLQLNECLVEDTICGTDDGQIAALQDSLALVEDEVMYWMEAYNNAVSNANDYIEDVIDNYEYAAAVIDTLQNELSDCSDAVAWNAMLLNECREELSDCEGGSIYDFPVVTGIHNINGEPVDENYRGFVIITYSNGAILKITQ
jgi:hypothetical protein